MTAKTDEGFALKLSENQVIYSEKLRCPGCKRFLGFYAIVWGVIKIKCPNCKEWTTLEISPEK